MDRQGFSRNPINIKEVEEKEVLKGIFRSTLAYSKNAMLCHFKLLKGSKISLHEHPNIQIGYVLHGKLQFFTEKLEFLTTAGDSYIFETNEKHGASVLEDTQVIEVFMPFREEYIDYG